MKGKRHQFDDLAERAKAVLQPRMRQPELKFTWRQSSMTRKSLVWVLETSDGSQELSGDSPTDLLEQLVARLEAPAPIRNTRPWAPPPAPAPRNRTPGIEDLIRTLGANGCGRLVHRHALVLTMASGARMAGTYQQLETNQVLLEYAGAALVVDLDQVTDVKDGCAEPRRVGM